MKIGIFGGSFDPAHLEHYRLCAHAIEALKLDKLIVVPARIPPHKKNAVLAKEEDRLNMLNITFRSLKKVEISDYEFKNDGASYTYLTLEHFKALYKDCDLYFLIGADMLDDFPTWRYPERILNAAFLFVTHRTGEDVEGARLRFIKAFKDYENKLLFSPYVGGSLSSSKIRNYSSLNISLSGLVSEGVEDYIKTHSLYKMGEISEFLIKSLPISRLIHTAGVMSLAERYAKRLKVDVKKARLAAMLHDVAKYFSIEDYPEFQIDESVPKQVVHQFLGEYVARNILGVDDKEVLSAVKYHTTGRKNMSVLEKIVFLADLLEEGRTYGEVEELRALVEKDFEQGFRTVVKRYYALLKRERDEVYYLTKECYDFYVNE